MNPTTVATFRFGMNTFADDRTPAVRVRLAAARMESGVCQFAFRSRSSRRSTLTGYAGTGFTGVSDTTTTPGASTARSPSSPARTASRSGADYRILGVDALSYGQSAGSYTFNGQFTGSNAEQPGGDEPQRDRRPAARLSLGGHPDAQQPLRQLSSATTASFVQDDWRVTDKLTVNYGVRLEHETGLAERNNQLVVGFDREAVSPLNVTIPADPVAGTPARQVLGGLVFAGQNGANESVGIPPTVKGRRASASPTA